MSREHRAEVLKEQIQLVKMLVKGAPVPNGFDQSRIKAAADILRHKRQKSKVMTGGKLSPGWLLPMASKLLKRLTQSSDDS